MIILLRTNSKDQGFIALVKQLDAELAVRDGSAHAFYDQFNKIDAINLVVVAFINNKPTGCGALKQYDSNTMEIKRMFTLEGSRGQGIASQILAELEHWTRDLHLQRCILETGKKQPEAIQLYRKQGYLAIPNYRPYGNVENSLCFEKKLIKVKIKIKN